MCHAYRARIIFYRLDATLHGHFVDGNSNHRAAQNWRCLRRDEHSLPDLYRRSYDGRCSWFLWCWLPVYG